MDAIRFYLCFGRILILNKSLLRDLGDIRGAFRGIIAFTRASWRWFAFVSCVGRRIHIPEYTSMVTALVK